MTETLAKVVKCDKCGSHWKVVGEDEAEVVKDTHLVICRDHHVMIVDTKQPLGFDFNSLAPAIVKAMQVTDLLEGIR